MRNSIAIAMVVIAEMYRRKDFYVLFVLTAVITGLMGSVTFFNDANIARYLKEICLFLIWISSLFIAIGTMARQLPAERESRTIFPLMAKPVSRAQVLIGKFLGCWLASGAALLVFYLFFGLVAATREHHWSVGNYFQALSLHWAMLAVVIALTLLGSLLLSAPSSNITITTISCVFILLVGRHLNKVAIHTGGVAETALYSIYYVIPHLEIFNVRDLIIHDWPLIHWSVWGVAVGYAAGYSAMLLLASWLVFRRKAFQ